MSNEAKTSQLFRNLLKEKGYYDDRDVIVEEQQTDNKRLAKLLQNASKSGMGRGFPDFIITCGRYPDLVVVVECKADTKKHMSETLDSFRDYAVDGALLYASFLSKEYDVIAIGFSGEKASLTSLSHFVQLNGERTHHSFFNDGQLLDVDGYYNGLKQSPIKFNQNFNRLIDYTKEVNEELQGKKIKERLRGLLISGILVALKNESFKAEYKNYKTTQELVTNLFNSIKVELEKSNVPDRNKKALFKGFEFIKTNQSINNPSAEGKQYLTDLISNCDNRINGFRVTLEYIDVISQFYVEFLRYANNDKGLGIVLTPPHITELFCELAQIDKDSVVLDNCAGTGGFLVSAMKKMLEDARTDVVKIQHIKDYQLVGIEFDEEIYTLLISNMIVHHDGRTNIFWEDCFKTDKEALIEKFHPTVGLLNPPYKNKGKGIEELEFVLNNLSMLKKGGICIAILPMSCVIDTKGDSYQLKKKILENNTLEGVLSMPEELFYNSKVNTDTCAIILRAGYKHPEGYKTWFGRCRDDGFEKRKNRGRIDVNHKWPEIKKKWVNAFLNRDEIEGLSVKHCVTAEMEWCAEAYMTANYEQLTEENFMQTVRDYYLFGLKCAQNESVDVEGDE